MFARGHKDRRGERGGDAVKKQPIRKEAKVGRNDPAPAAKKPTARP